MNRTKYLTGLLLIAAFAAHVAAGSVIINEINYNPPGSDDLEEFVELYNTGSAHVDLAGWKFDKGFDFVFPAGASIVSEGYVVVARDLEAFRSRYPGVAAYGPFADGKLSNSGEGIRLLNSRGAIECEMAYLDGGEWPSECDGDGNTLELRHPSLSLVSPKSWGASLDLFGTPGAPNSLLLGEGDFLLETKRDPMSPQNMESVMVGVRALFGHVQGVKVKCGGVDYTASEQKDGYWTATLPGGKTGDRVDYTFAVRNESKTEEVSDGFMVLENYIPEGAIVVNEIMWNSGTYASDSDYQYVELYNCSGTDYDLAGCSIGGEVIDSKKSVMLKAGEYVVAASKKKDLEAVYGSLPLLAGVKIALRGDGGVVCFKDPNGRVISRGAYGSDENWPSLCNGAGYSLELLNPGLDGLESGNWGVSALYGSPGKKNTATGTIGSVFVQPYCPLTVSPSEKIDLRFKIQGDNIQNVVLEYGTSDKDLKVLTLNAGTDGIYAASLEGLGNGLTLRYRLKITQNATTAYWPPQKVSASQKAASMTTRMSYQSHLLTVEPTREWQKAEITDNASDPSKMYFYMDAKGEILLDDIKMADNSQNYISNGDFSSNLNGWNIQGNHSGSYRDTSDGVGGKGCLHIVATGAGGGNGAAGFIIPTLSPNLTSGNSYTLSFYYKLPQESIGAEAVFRYVTVGETNVKVGISEINYHEMHASFGNGEYLEIYNYGDTAADLAGWKLVSENSGAMTLPRFELPAKAFLYVCADTNVFKTTYASEKYLATLGFALSHSGDTLRLFDSKGKLVDTVSYGDKGFWPEGADGNGDTLERKNMGANGTDPDNWDVSHMGTVGDAYGSFRIKNAIHHPAVPTSSSRVYFYCMLENASGTINGTLHYRKGSGSWQTQTMSYNSANKRMSASLTGLSNNTQLSFYYEIQRGSKTLYFPVWKDKRPCMLEVDDITDYEIPVYRLLMTSENYNKLSSQRLWNNNCTDGTVIIGTNIFYNTAIHYKGNYSRYYRVAHNMRFAYGKKYHGHRKIAYTYNWEDGSPYLAVGYAQRVYREGKVPIYDSEAVLTRRMGSLQGLMHSVEGYDDEHLAKLGYNGNCYKAVAADAQQAMFSYANYRAKTYENCYEPLANMNPDRQYKDLARGLECLYIFNEKDFQLKATNYFDVMAAAQEWAMMKFLNNSDGWTQWGQNYILYGDKDNGRLQLWPQDIGSCVVWGNVPLMPIVGGIQRFCRLPAVNMAFYQSMTNFMAVMPLNRQLEIFDSLRDMCKKDAQRNDGSYVSEASNLRNTIRNWATTVNSSVGSPTYVTNMPFAFKSLPPRNAYVGEPYYYRPYAFDRYNRKVTYSCSGNNFVKMDSDGLISGVFTNAGQRTFTVRANVGGRTIAQSVTVYVQEPGLQLYIPMDSLVKHTVSDIDGKMEGSASGAVNFDSEGRYGGCLSFGGAADDVVTMGTHSDIDMKGNYTIEAWLYFTQRTRNYWGRLFKKYEELGFRLKGDNSAHHGGLIAWGPFDNGYSRTVDGFPGDGDSYIMDRYNTDDNNRIMEPNQWHHMAVTFERERNEAFVYVDGNRVSGLTWSENLNSSGSPLYLGGSLNAKLDELKIYSFAKRSFNMGLNFEALCLAPESQTVQFHYFDRKDGKEHSLKNYALHVMPENKFYPLPSEKVRPGEDIVIKAEDISGDFALPPSGSLALYAFEPESPFPEYYLTNDYSKILDYVAWGGEEALPKEKDAAVIAGLWKAGTIVQPKERALRLKERGMNNRGADSWENALNLAAPQIVSCILTNTENQIEGSWSKPEGALNYRVQYADNPYFQNALTRITSNQSITITEKSGDWYWRVQANYNEGQGVYSKTVKTTLIPEPSAIVIILSAIFLMKRRVVHA